MGTVNESARTFAIRGTGDHLSRVESEPGLFISIPGKILDRHHSTITREVDRNGGRQEYRAVDAQRRADGNRPRPKARKLETSQRLHDAVNDGLREKWSPKQISERLREDHPDDPEMHVSHETIYECPAPRSAVSYRPSSGQRMEEVVSGSNG